ncbi:MAG: hypothetical protein QOE03_1073 [Micromonosporaceae bacterium]|jgi:hypothetical protein|nr:hypothetical protein [Micromonosporaceae bacterium]
MSGAPDSGPVGRDGLPADGFDFTLVVLDDAGAPHLALSAADRPVDGARPGSPAVPPGAADRLPGPAVRGGGRQE